MIVAFSLLCLVGAVIGVGLVDNEIELRRQGRGSILALVVFLGLAILLGYIGTDTLIDFFTT